MKTSEAASTSPSTPPEGRSGGAAFRYFAARALAFAHRRPLLAAVVVVVMWMLPAIVVFEPKFDTNDDTTMNLIVAGKGVCQQPDEHMLFSHVLLGLALKHLYLVAPSVPWYGVYLFVVHAVSHVALVFMLFQRRLGWQSLAAYVAYAATAGVLLLTALQFTTTAFLAAQSGLFLGLFAFLRAADGESRLARRSAIAGAALLLVAALIRWHVFMLFFSLAVPAAGVLAWVYRRQKRLLFTTGAWTALLLVGLFGVSLINGAYYARDPRWADFYSYNELRAQINDLAWVYYSPETAHVFPQVGWTVNDYAMIQAWFFDDPAVYNAAKLQELLDAYPWKESAPDRNGIADLIKSLVNDPQIVPLLVLIPFMTWTLRRNATGQAALLLTCVWICGLLWLATVLRKPPPPRVYMPLLAFPVAIALVLGTIGRRAKAAAAQETGAASRARRRNPLSIALRMAIAPGCALVAACGLVSSLSLQFDQTAQNTLRREAFYRELSSIATHPEKLFICWGGGIPYELLRPLDNLQWLSDLNILHFGCMQQCPFHIDMKRQFGIDDLPGVLADRPDVVFISHPACLPLMTTYIREHHGREVHFERTGRFLTAVVARAAPGPAAVIASQAEPTR